MICHFDRPKWRKGAAFRFAAQRIGDFLPYTPPELLEKVSGTSKEVYWLMLFMLGAYVLAPWGIPVSSAASPRLRGAAIGWREVSGWIRSGVGTDLGSARFVEKV